MSSNGRYQTQSDNPTAWVGVHSDGYHRDTNQVVATDILVQQKGPGGSHIHVGFDEYGNQIFGPAI